ncbi:MAG TPA: hypothetical protein DSN98_01710 [Thermoplasmata archaeon]|jgi:hypothetical protein|nr:MAG TPA: hypothetical protein DSN98_01710 [Thermoplasmata archaeon]
MIEKEKMMKTSTNRRNESAQKLLLRLELWFAPLLLVVPLIVSLVFLGDWYVKGFIGRSASYDGELFLGLLLLIGNLLFDIPFLRSLRMQKKKQ